MIQESEKQQYSITISTVAMTVEKRSHKHSYGVNET